MPGHSKSPPAKGRRNGTPKISTAARYRNGTSTEKAISCYPGPARTPPASATATPDGPFAIQGLFSSIQATPAISRCSQGVSPTNSFRNIAAVIAPPQRPPMLTRSAMGLDTRDIRHPPADATSSRPISAARSKPHRRLLLPKTPVLMLPSATMPAPVSVAASIRCVAPSCLA